MMPKIQLVLLCTALLGIGTCYSEDIELSIAYQKKELFNNTEVTRTFAAGDSIDICVIAMSTSEKNNQLDVQGLEHPNFFAITDEKGRQIDSINVACQTFNHDILIRKAQAYILGVFDIHCLYKLTPNHTYTVSLPAGAIGMNSPMPATSHPGAKVAEVLEKQRYPTMRDSNTLVFTVLDKKQ